VVDHRSDLFSLGCLFYFLCTGRPPFDAENTLAVLHKIVSEDAAPLAAQREGLPPSFVGLVHQLLHRCADKRPHDCEGVIEKLCDAQSELHDGKVAKPPLIPHGRLAWIAAAGAMVGLMVGAYAVWKSSERAGGWSGQGSAAAVVANPWSIGNESGGNESGTTERISPYLVRASLQIDSAVVMDTDQFRQRVDILEQQLEQLDHPPDSIVFPPIDLGQDEWRRDVAEVEMLIRQAGQW